VKLLRRSVVLLFAGAIALVTLPGRATAGVDPPAIPNINKSYPVSSIVIGETTTLTIELSNFTTTDFDNAGFADQLPSELAIQTGTGTSPLCGGTLTVTASTISLANATLTAGTVCTASVTVTGIAVGQTSNTVEATPGGNRFTAELNVRPLSPPVLTKQFTPSTIPVNGTSSLSFTLRNPNASRSLTGIGFTDTLPSGVTFQPVAATPTCNGGSLEVTSTLLTLTGAALAAGAECQFSVSVTGTTPGPKLNTTSRVRSAETAEGLFAQANLVVLTPPLLGKTFSAELVPLNGTVRMALDVSNGNSVPVTGLGVTDSLPAGLVVADPPNAANSCGGTLTAAAGSSLVQLTGGTVAANGQCTVSVDVTPTAAGPITNTTGAVTSTNAGTGNTADDTITVVQRPTATKTFGADTVPQGGTTSLTIVVTNPDTAVTQTGVAFTDTLPDGLVVATPNGQAGSCGASSTITAVAGSGTVSLAGGEIAPTGQCTIKVDVTGTTVGPKVNSVTPSSNQGGTGEPASDTVLVLGPPAIEKAFGAPSIPLNGTTTLTFTIANFNTVAASGLAFSDVLPGGLVVASPNGVSNGCGGTVTALAGSSSISLVNGTVAAGLACEVKVDVLGETPGPKDNESGAVTSTNGGTGDTAQATLLVVAPPEFAKAFGRSVFPINGTTTLTFTILNPNSATGLSGVAFSDTLPAGLVVGTPNGLSNTCGGTVTAAAGSGSIALSGGSIPASGSCTVRVNVRGTSPGAKTNTSGAVTSIEGGTGDTATASVIVALPPTLTKAFNPSPVRVGATTTLTFTLTNPNTTTPLTGVTFADPLPLGLMVSPTPSVSNTCGGVPGVGPYALAVSLASASIPAGQSCTFRVTLTATSAGVKNNTTTIVSSTQGGIGSPASASVTVTP
jgi:uncharacterized repeat protein (TIGR01451 family)